MVIDSAHTTGNNYFVYAKKDVFLCAPRLGYQPQVMFYVLAVFYRQRRRREHFNKHIHHPSAQPLSHISSRDVEDVVRRFIQQLIARFLTQQAPYNQDRAIFFALIY